MSCTIPTITCVTGPVLGGISDMYIIRSKDVLGIPDCCCEDGHTITEPLTIRSDAEFVRLEFRPGSARYSYTGKDTDHGPLYDIEVDLAHKKLSPEVDEAVTRLGPGHYILIATDFNGYRRLIGNLDNPMRLLPNGTTGARRADTNFADWKFVGRSKCPACYLDTDISFPNSTDSLVAHDPVYGDNDDDGRFVPNDDGIGVVGDPAGLNAGYVLASGFILDEQGQPVPPGTDLKIGIDLINVQTGLSLYGEVEIPYTSDINFNTTNATGGSGMTSWNTIKIAFYKGGTGVNSLDPDAPGRFDFYFNKQLWASTGSFFDLDSVDVMLKMKVQDRLVWGNEKSLRIQKFIRTDISNRIYVSEFKLATLVVSSSGGSYTKDVIDVLLDAASTALPLWSTVPGSYTIDIDGNTQSGDFSDAIAIGSPVAGNAGITAISGTLANPVITCSNASAHSIPITVSYDIDDTISTYIVEQKFYIVRDDLDTDPYLIQANWATSVDLFFNLQADMVEGNDIRLKANWLVENGGAGAYTQVIGSYSELYGFTQQDDPAVYEYAWIETDLYDMDTFTVTATMSGMTAPDLTEDDVAYSTCLIRLNIT